MTRNNLVLLATLGAAAGALAAIKLAQRARPGSGPAPLVLYEPLPHPYLREVGEGAAAYGREAGVPVRIAVGQESTQANVDANVESLFATGERAFSLYPVDPAGFEGLLHRLRAGGGMAVAYGAQPLADTAAPFAVATDVRRAAQLAAEQLAGLMGRRGRVLDVLESMTDANTPIRRRAVEQVIAEHRQMQIIQTVGDVTTEQQAREKIESALAARGGEIDGVICTGYTTTVAAAVLLAAHNRAPGAQRVHFVGLDTDARVLEAIRAGEVDATLAQNPYGHGYLSCALLDLLARGWRPRAPYQFIDAGCVVVTRANVDTFSRDIDATTRQIAAGLRRRYFLPRPGAE